MANKISPRGAAHDLRHLLTIMRLTAEQLEQADNADTAYKAARILRSVDRAAEICSTLLGAQQVNTMTSVKAVIDDVITQVDAPDGVDMLCDCPDDLFLTKPQAPLFRLLFNLVLNAVSAVDNGAGSNIIVAARELDSHVAILVKDDGPGLGSVTDRVEKWENRQGLGLRIAQSCVAELDGRLELIQKESTGAAMAVWLPRPEYWPAATDADGEVLSA